MEKDTKDALGGCLALIVIIIFSVFIGNSVIHYSVKIINDYNRELKEKERFLGEKVIYNNDTLLLINYDFWDSSYKLENGKELHIKVIEKLEKVGANESEN